MDAEDALVEFGDRGKVVGHAAVAAAEEALEDVAVKLAPHLVQFAGEHLQPRWGHEAGGAGGCAVTAGIAAGAWAPGGGGSAVSQTASTKSPRWRTHQRSVRAPRGRRVPRPAA